ncbi:MAG: NAD(P)/FAD-dependent oxidoreductase [Abditibacteriaceae bacterium]
MKRVVVVGAGFGGLDAARHLASRADDAELEVLLVDKHNYHTFMPLLYQVATAMQNVESIAFPVRALFHGKRNIEFLLAEVQRIDATNKKLETTTGPVEYDYLVLAGGSVTNFFGMDSVAKVAFELKDLNDATRLRNQILESFENASCCDDSEKQKALMTFVVVGGGPTGVEFSGALSELIQHVLTKDFPHLSVNHSRIILVEAGDHLLTPFPKSLQQYALQRLKTMGVDVRLGNAVKEATPTKVVLKDGTEIKTHTLFWAAGVKAANIGKTLGVELQKGGRVPVTSDLSIKVHPDIFVVGDMMYLEQDGKPLPMVAPVAMQSGEYVAAAISRRESGKPAKPFHYTDKGSMAVVGRNAAVAFTKGIKMKGFPAWIAWLGLHIYYLVGFRNRLITLVNWAFDYIFFSRQVRLINKAPKED